MAKASNARPGAKIASIPCQCDFVISKRKCDAHPVERIGQPRVPFLRATLCQCCSSASVLAADETSPCRSGVSHASLAALAKDLHLLAGNKTFGNAPCDDGWPPGGRARRRSTRSPSARRAPGTAAAHRSGAAPPRVSRPAPALAPAPHHSRFLHRVQVVLDTTLCLVTPVGIACSATGRPWPLEGRASNPMVSQGLGDVSAQKELAT